MPPQRLIPRAHKANSRQSHMQQRATSNQKMQPTAGRRNASLHFMKIRLLQATLAFASGGCSCSRYVFGMLQQRFLAQWSVFTPIIYRMMERQYVDLFFDTGELLISSFEH